MDARDAMRLRACLIAMTTVLGCSEPVGDGDFEAHEQTSDVEDDGETSSSSSTSGGDVDDTGDAETASDDGSGDEPQACHEAIPRGTVAYGEPCAINAECITLVCEGVFESVNAPGSGTCGHTPPDCRTRVSGTVFDMRTLQPVVGVDLAVIPAAEAAAGVQMASHLLDMVSDDQGRFDATTQDPLRAFIAVLGLSTHADYAASTQGLSGPVDGNRNYEPSFTIRDWWVVSHADLVAWNEDLANDPQAAPLLPLDEAWDVVGMVRPTTYPALPLDEVSLAPVGESTAVVRYLNDDGLTFNSEATSSHGIFVVLGSGPGLAFTVTKAGMEPLFPDAVRAGIFPDAVYTMMVWMQPIQPVQPRVPQNR